jgi:hypothetical protein
MCERGDRSFQGLAMPAIQAAGGEAMIGWRFWMLLAVGIGFVLWAGSALVLRDGTMPRVLAGWESPSAKGETDSGQIREESREAMREILRRAERDHESDR